MKRLRLFQFSLLGAVCLSFRASAPPTASAYWAEVLYNLYQYDMWQDTTQGNVQTLTSSYPEAEPLRRRLEPLNSSPTYFAYTLNNGFSAFRTQLNIPFEGDLESHYWYAIQHGPLMEAASLRPVVRELKPYWLHDTVSLTNGQHHINIRRNWIAQYDAQGLQQLFNRLYPPPGTSISGIPSQQVYNLVFKDYVRGVAHIWSAAVSNAATFKQMAQRYAAKAFANDSSHFDGFMYSIEHTPTILGVKWRDIASRRDAAQGGQVMGDNAYRYTDRLVGILLRRQIDGTLPTVLGCLKRVLRDYDPEAYAQYGSQLVLN